jgi:hypothetical protein
MIICYFRKGIIYDGEIDEEGVITLKEKHQWLVKWFNQLQNNKSYKKRNKEYYTTNQTMTTYLEMRTMTHAFDICFYPCSKEEFWNKLYILKIIDDKVLQRYLTPLVSLTCCYFHNGVLYNCEVNNIAHFTYYHDHGYKENEYYFNNMVISYEQMCRFRLKFKYRELCIQYLRRLGMVLPLNKQIYPCSKEELWESDKYITNGRISQYKTWLMLYRKLI